MRQTLRPYVTAGIAIVGASLIAVTPVAPPQPNVQQRAAKLVDYTEYDASQLASATEANWSGLETVLSSSNWTTDPDISQGLSTLFTDLSTGASNPVTNPFSLLIEGSLGLLSSTDAANAASTALTAVTDNVESAFSGGDYSLALTDLENGPTTVLYAFLNGYPESVGSGNYLSPEFGLLTNTVDGAATGQLDGLQQLSNTLADEISAIGGGDLTTTPTLFGPGTLDLSAGLDQLLGDLFPGGTVTLPPIETLLADLFPSLSSTDLDLIGSLLGTADISIPLSTLESLLPSSLSLDVPIPEVTGGAVPTFDYDLSQALLAVLGSIAPVSSDLPTLLTSDPTLDVVPLLSSLLTDLGLPISLTGGDLPINLTGVGAELLAGLVP
jgi:hypothetical protein